MGEQKIQPKYMKVRDYSRMMGVARGWVYDEIKAGRLPIATFCGIPLTPLHIDLEKAQELFSSSAGNVIPITRSLKTEKSNETANHRKLATKEDLWE